MNRILSVSGCGLLLSSVLLLAARAEVVPGSETRQVKTEVTVTFWHAMGGPLGRTLNEMIREFEQTHPGIRIVSVSMGDYGSLAQKLMSALWVKRPPVIAQMYESWTTQFLEAGQLTPVASLIRADLGSGTDAFLQDYFPALLANNSWAGQLLTFPFNKSVPVYYYNQRRFDSLGIGRFPETWSEFRAVARRLTRRVGSRSEWTWGTAGGVNASLFVSMVKSHGGELMDESTGRPGFAGPEGIDVLRFQSEMILQDSSQVFSVGYSGQDDLLSGRIGMIYGTSVSRAYMKGKERFPIGMAPLPCWDRPAALIQGTNIGFFRQSSRAELAAAWEFVRWFTAPRQQAHWAAQTFYVPACRSALEEPEFRGLLDSVPGWRECVAQIDHAVFEPKGRAWFEGRKIMDSGLEPALRGLLSPEQSLALAAAQMAPARATEGRPAFYLMLVVAGAGLVAGLGLAVRKPRSARAT